MSEPLKGHTTFKIGGRARYFAEPANEGELKNLLSLAKKEKLRVLILGAGSNLLVDDRGVNALVIRLGAPYFKRIIFKGRSIEAGGGAGLALLISRAARKGLGGHEFLAGIPGTVGGALVMNAGQGQGGSSIGDLIDRLRVMDYNGNVNILPKKKIKFNYRSSGLDKYIILSAYFKLRRQNKNKVKGIIKGYFSRRIQSQDVSGASAGCAFRNPQGDSAGRLIELAGLKGAKVGGAQVSRKHANFIINRRGATCQDVLELMRVVKREVKNKFKLELEPEVKIWRR